MLMEKGTGFEVVWWVEFRRVALRSVKFVSSTQVKAVAPAHAAGVVNVFVTTPGGASAAANGNLYAFGSPTVSSFSPPSGITGRSVTINGPDFVPGPQGQCGTRPAAPVTV